MSDRIAELEKKLAAEPASRVFLDLARAYHEAGQFEKALGVCARGAEKHAGWLSARVLLGRIHFDMGSLEEARQAMQQVLDAAPDNLIARRVLAEISLEQGDRDGALDRFRALLAFNPADTEIRRKIETLEGMEPATVQRPRSSDTPVGAPAEPVASTPPAQSPVLLVEDDRPEPDSGPRPEPATVSEQAPSRETGALATPTLAEIYLQQGLTGQAIDVYREILAGDPENQEAAARLMELKSARPAKPDPQAALRRRKIEALSGWLRAIGGEPHA